MAAQRFEFAFAPLYRPFAAMFGVLPATAFVEVDDRACTARFGPWLLRTPLDNVLTARLTGPYGLPKTLGPAHLSFADYGMTMATNNKRGVCMQFRDPVPGLAPTDRIAHPGLTVTVADCDGLLSVLALHGQVRRPS
jgi:hypothetical protein